MIIYDDEKKSYSRIFILSIIIIFLTGLLCATTIGIMFIYIIKIILNILGIL